MNLKQLKVFLLTKGTDNFPIQHRRMSHTDMAYELVPNRWVHWRIGKSIEDHLQPGKEQVGWFQLCNQELDMFLGNHREEEQKDSILNSSMAHKMLLQCKTNSVLASQWTRKFVLIRRRWNSREWLKLS